VLVLAWLPARLCADEGHYPQGSWQRLDAPEKLGWSREKLRAARDYTATIATAAVMVVVDGQVLDEWGETATRFNVNSIRKSFLNALYGIAVRNGRIDLSATMEQLGIDDNEPSLTAVEKKARIADLLKSRSGIYHTANYQTEEAKAKRPARGSPRARHVLVLQQLGLQRPRHDPRAPDKRERVFRVQGQDCRPHRHGGFPHRGWFLRRRP
jgi:CubicO group peptidase (beta-lactamase class C family)